MEINTKFQMISKPVQIGKTFECIDQIKQHIEMDEMDGRSLHFIFTQNTMLNQSQFFERLPFDKVITLGSKKKANDNHINTLLEMEGSLLGSKTGKNIVVMCSHDKRFQNIRDFCQKYDQEKHPFCQRIYIYIDEIHEYISLCQNFINSIKELKIVKKIIGLTATVGPLFEFFEHFMLANYQCSNYDNYQSLSQHIFIHPDVESKTTIEYAEKVLEMFYDDFYVDGKRTFIPSGVKKCTHDDMKDLIVSKANGKNIIVLVINSQHKCFYYINNGVEKIVENQNSNLQISDNISEFVKKHYLQNVPLFVTGHKCIKVGITICNSDIGAFTSSVISHHMMSPYKDSCKYESNLYQLVGRTTGNVKIYEGFYNTKIFCTTKVRDIVLPMERRATNLDVKAQLDQNKLITREEYIGNNSIHYVKKISNYDIDYRVFDTDKYANEFIKLNKMSSRPGISGLNKEFTNKSIQDILSRKWGFSTNNYRKIKIHYDDSIENKIDDGKILVYWKKENYDKIIEVIE